MCPFLDKSDVRCAAHLTLANLATAFAYCADRFADCPVYQALVQERITNDPTYKHANSRLAAAS
ncbi:MAG: hypothetical protein SVT52_01085 [Planctomycetota bacterium]|nr:hypothetical protein [Planctomycetota bacterium]